MIVFDGSTLINYFIEGARTGLLVGFVVWFGGLSINYVIKIFRHV